MSQSKEVLVLGAGVSGLSSAILLLKNGWKVTIWAKDLPPNTTSNKAAAVWYPYLCSPREKALPWAKNTFEYLQSEMISVPESGCIEETMVQFFDEAQDQPWWASALPYPIEHPKKEDLPDGYVDGYTFKTIVIDTSMYMDYLVKTYKDLGGKLLQKEISHIDEAFSELEIVVNCTGLGSRTLFNDNLLFPVRGQMVKVKHTGLKELAVDDSAHNFLSLVIPRIGDIMLGGTAQKDNWSTEIDPDDTAEIIRKAKIICPALKKVEVISESVGLRPARESVRVEKVLYNEKTLIHNYGHGGAGFTLSWGCAQDVVDFLI